MHTLFGGILFIIPIVVGLISVQIGFRIIDFIKSLHSS